MGLDMYLAKRTYVKNWDHMKPAEKHKITTKGPEAASIDTKKISYIVEDAGYWRKANQIHNWFVNNVQKGEDDCKDYHVSNEQLEELLDVVKQVLKAPNKAKDLLPVQTGFFFGSKEYDQYYFQDLEYTKKLLEDLLKDPANMSADFYYHSSW